MKAPLTLWTSRLRWSPGWWSHTGPALLLVVALLVVLAGSTNASATNGNLPGGTSITVAINSPANGAVLPPGTVAVNGTASVGQGLPVANTALVYVLDVSASTVNSGTGCGGDQNGDGLSNSVLDCEIAAARALNTTAAANGTVGDVGIVVFGDAGVAADVGPAAGDQPLTGPGTDANANSTRDVDEVLSSVHLNGTTAAAGVSLFTAKTPGSPGG